MKEESRTSNEIEIVKKEQNIRKEIGKKEVAYKTLLNVNPNAKNSGMQTINSLEHISDTRESQSRHVSTIILPESSKLKALLKNQEEDYSPERPNFETQLTELDKELKISVKKSGGNLILLEFYLKCISSRKTHA